MVMDAALQNVAREIAPHRFPRNIRTPWYDVMRASARGAKKAMRTMVRTSAIPLTPAMTLYMISTIENIPPTASPSPHPLVACDPPLRIRFLRRRKCIAMVTISVMRIRLMRFNSPARSLKHLFPSTDEQPVVCRGCICTPEENTPKDLIPCSWKIVKTGILGHDSTPSKRHSNKTTDGGYLECDEFIDHVAS